jgi:hypothetical protein
VQYQGAKLAWNGRRLALPIHVGEKEKGRLAVTTARIGLHVLTGSATDLDSVSLETGVALLALEPVLNQPGTLYRSRDRKRLFLL